jgi:hypothetical protein
MATMELVVHLPKPHQKQRDFLRSPAKRKVVRAGRRGGKTVGMAIKAVEAFLQGRRVLYAAPTTDQINTFWRHVRDALQPCIDAGLYIKNETEKTIELRGSEQRIKAKTAWNADTLRGDYADLLILDEWQLMNEDAWGVVGAPMLLDNNGDVVFIYTPPSARTAGVSKAQDKRHAAKLFKMAEADTTGRWQAFTFSSHDNPHLSQDALQDITGDMSNLAYRQEIMAEDIDEVPGALWTRATLDKNRVNIAPSLYRIVVAVDPEATASETSAETGIIVAGKDENEIGYLLEDKTLRASPAEWGAAVVRAYDRWRADVVVAETNNGGDMVRFVVEAAAQQAHRNGERDTPYIAFKQVHASRGKYIRAEPVSTLYENGRCKHVGTFDELEDQLCSWLPGDTSPDRLDALVWAYTDLLVGNSSMNNDEFLAQFGGNFG